MTGDSAANTTVVLPVWDRYVSTRLDEALASLREQDSKPRIIVVDNASETPLPDFADVPVVRASARLSLGEAQNLGLANVTTRYVLFWDADDLMLPGTLTFLEEAIKADDAYAAFGAAILEEPSNVRHRWPRRWIGRLVQTPMLLAGLDCVWSIFPTTGATIMRTEFVRSCGAYADADSGQDWCLGVSLAFRGRIGWSERPGRMYRIDPQSVWARHMSMRHQLRHAGTVRRRIREDEGIPGAVRLALPLIGAAQYAAIGLHELVSATRRLRRPDIRR